MTLAGTEKERVKGSKEGNTACGEEAVVIPYRDCVGLEQLLRRGNWMRSRPLPSNASGVVARGNGHHRADSRAWWRCACNPLLLSHLDSPPLFLWFPTFPPIMGWPPAPNLADAAPSKRYHGRHLPSRRAGRSGFVEGKNSLGLRPLPASDGIARIVGLTSSWKSAQTTRPATLLFGCLSGAGRGWAEHT